MLFKKNKGNAAVAVGPEVKNTSISLEFLPDGKVMPVVYWKPGSNVDAQLFSKVVNLLNEGKLYEPLKQTILKYGAVSGDVELTASLDKLIKDPRSNIDDKPLIRADEVFKHLHLHLANLGGDND